MKFSDYDLAFLTGLERGIVITLIQHSKAKSRFEIGANIAFEVALIPFLFGIAALADELSAFQQSRLLKNIFKEVAKFNAVVENLEILEKLKKAGNKVDVSDRDKVIKALELMKEDLIRALKTEKILRENALLEFKAKLKLEDFLYLKLLGKDLVEDEI